MEDNCSAMVIMSNPGISNTELAEKLSEFGELEYLHVFRQIYDNKFIHLSVAIVDYKNPESTYKFLENGNKFKGLRALKIDRFYFKSSMGLIVGLKRTENIDFYVKLFMQQGAHSIRVHEPIYTTDPFCFLVSFPDDQQRTAFKHQINGMNINGQVVKLIPLRYHTSSVFNPKNPLMSSVLNLEDKWDFTIYHFENTYKCWKGAAFAMSPTIREYLTKENTDFYTAPRIVGPFQLIMNYFHGQSVDIKGSNAPFLLQMSEALGMKHLTDSVNRFISCATDPFTIIYLIIGYQSMGSVPDHLIHSLAATFEDVKNITIFKFLPTQVLNRVISSPAFESNDEDSLFHWVMEFLSLSTEKFRVLIRNVRISKLSKQCIIDFLNIPPSLVDLNDFRLSLSYIGLRAKFSHKSALEIIEKSDNPYNSQFIHRLFVPIELQYNRNNMFNGLFSFYHSHFPPANFPVEITASSCAIGKPEKIIDEYEDCDFMFESQNVSMSNIRIKLLKDKLSLSGYSIRSHNRKGNGHMVSWRLSGSNDGDVWSTIDYVDHSNSLSNNGAQHYFMLEKESQFFSMFELKQMRTNSMGYYHMRLSKLEFFGVLIPSVFN